MRSIIPRDLPPVMIEPPATILLIDSSVEEARLTQLVLRDALGEVSIRVAADALEFAEAYAAARYDAILVDVRLPWTEGDDLLAALGRRFSAPIVVFGCCDCAEETGRLLKAGAREVLSKSVQAYAVTLAPLVASALRERPPASPPEEASSGGTPDSPSNEILSNFAHLVAHEARRPAERIRRAARLLSLEYGSRLNEDARELLDHLQSSAADVTELVNDLLELGELAKSGLVETEELALEDLLRTVAGEMKEFLQHHGVELTIDPLPRLHGNGRLLRGLFRNLIENGVKYNRSTPPAIRVYAEPEGSYWSVCVADNGLGIPEESREAVFEPFHRLYSRDEFAGSGLGLALCRRVAQAHGGSIEAGRREPSGTVMRLRLPRR